MNDVLLILSIILVAGIAGACICRINLLKYSTHDYRWVALYLLTFAFAGGNLADALSSGKPMSIWNFAGIAAAALELWLSRSRWPGQAPYESFKKQFRVDRRTGQGQC